MKGRSHHRLPISDPPDDWGDGSWTVDCICGVTYDDGEEMVSCDECGVWVHTRCCRFVKGEMSFACDKCKSKRGRSIDNSEETEVAQLLVELPNKTVHVGPPPPPPVPPRPPFRLWTDIPIEERVHVQGVPGGDPDLFQNLSSVFTSQLWKCTGYVPKKFNFQYREFPCWEDDEKRPGPDFPVPEENESPADRGADVLFSLSKEIIPYAPSADIGGLRALVDGVSCERKLSPKDKRREGAKGVSYGGRMHNSVKKEKNQLRPVAIQLGKRKKDESGGLKERSGKKKARGSEKEADNRKRGSSPAVDAHVLELCEGSLKVADFQNLKDEDQKENIHAELTANVQLQASDNDLLKPKMSVTPAVVLPIEAVGHNSPPEELIKTEKIEQEDATNTVISPSVDAFKVFVVEANDVARDSIKEEDGNTAVDGLNHVKDESNNKGDLSGGSSNVAVDTEEPKPSSGDLGSTQDVQGTCLLQQSNGTVSPISLLSKSKAEVAGSMLQKSNGTVSPISLPSNSKAEVGSEAKGDSGMLPPVGDEKLDPAKHLSQCSAVVNSVENLQLNDTALSNSLTGDLKAKYVEREPAAASCLNNDTVAEGIVSTLSKPYQCRQESEDSTGPLKLQEVSSKSWHSAKYVEESLKPGGMKPNPPTSTSLRRLLVGVGKSSSTSSTIAVSKSSVSVSYKSVAPPASQVDAKHINFSKQRLKVKSSTDRKKDNSKTDTRRDENKQEVPRAPVKDRPKSPSSSGFKTSQPGRSSQSTSVCKHSSDAKEQVLSSSSKASAAQGSLISSGSVDHANLLQAQSASQGKHTALSSCQKSEKISQSSSQPSSKVFSHSPSMHPPANVNSSAVLSDEELALLLHQELNSSPRVPRVPRVRHAGSIPQLASPTATSMLAKRPSFSGGKDHISASRRKTKEDACKDNSRNSREQVEESRKLNRLPPSPDRRRQDSASTTDGPSKKDACNRSPDAVGSANKAVLAASTDVANLPSSVEVNDQNPSSIRSLPRDVSDDDTGEVVGLTPRTLPVLIAEIMSKGKRTTYEELCDAVLPHWNNLRKHNGERYAYSSHSQAVLDCLRNRNEWAHLIDRGPKTNSSRKRRKPDADPPAVESEDEDDGDGDLKQEGRSVKSNQEDVPKGKRKARKRRRLTLQGKGLKEVRKRQKAEAALDEDFGVFSHSSEGTESIFSEDESQGGRTDAISEASTSSSDEDGMM